MPDAAASRKASDCLLSILLRSGCEQHRPSPAGPVWCDTCGQTIVRCVGRTRSSTAAKIRAGNRRSAPACEPLLYYKGCRHTIRPAGVVRSFILGLAGKQISLNERLDSMGARRIARQGAVSGGLPCPAITGPAKDRSGIFRINKGLYGKLHHGCVLFVQHPSKNAPANTV